VNATGPLAVYGPHPRRSAKRLAELVDAGQLQSLEHWLASLTA
jgi:hypothetical protein